MEYNNAHTAFLDAIEEEQQKCQEYYFATYGLEL